MFNVGGKGELPWGEGMGGRSGWGSGCSVLLILHVMLLLLSLKDFVRGLMCQVVCFGDHKQHSISLNDKRLRDSR